LPENGCSFFNKEPVKVIVIADLTGFGNLSGLSPITLPTLPAIVTGNHTKVNDNHTKVTDNHTKVITDHTKVTNDENEAIGMRHNI